MEIRGSRGKEYSHEILQRLLSARSSGQSISKTEVQKELKAARKDLKDAFEHSFSTTGLAKTERAVRNTFELALESGWIKGADAKKLVETFLSGNDEGSLRAEINKVKDMVRAHNAELGSWSSNSAGYSARAQGQRGQTGRGSVTHSAQS